MTCETGPGSPSGHCMVAVAGWLPVVIFLLNRYNRFNTILATTFVSFISLVCVSRLYIAAHFPHQVIGGIFGGLIIGMLAYAWAKPYLTNDNSAYGRDTYNERRPSFLLSPIWLIIISVGSFALTRILDALLTATGVDVNWSYRLAEKACQNPKWVNPATSLSATYARTSGLIFGLAVAFMYRPAMPHCSPASSKTLKRAFVSSAVSILAVVTMNNLFISVTEVATNILPSLLSLLAMSASTDSPGSNPNFLVWVTLKAMICPILVALCLPTMLARGCVRQAHLGEEENNANMDYLLTRGELVNIMLNETNVKSNQKQRRLVKKNN